MATETHETNGNAGQWEYTTYPPAGERCSACLRPLSQDEPVWRGAIERPSDAPVTLYRHIKCPKGAF